MYRPKAMRRPGIDALDASCSVSSRSNSQTRVPALRFIAAGTLAGIR